MTAEDIYLIPQKAWDFQGQAYLELSEEEKVKIMIMARNRNFSLIECHSHRSPHGVAEFSPSDLKGLEEFIGYVRWKLPGKKYGALVWAESTVKGLIWDCKRPAPLPINEVSIVGKNGKLKDIGTKIRPRRGFFGWTAGLFGRGER
jgi:hypothetical protein